MVWCEGLTGPHTRHLSMVLAEQKRRMNTDSDCLRLRTCLAGMGLASPVDSCAHSARGISGSWGLVYICSCRACTDHPQAAAPGSWCWMCVQIRVGKCGPVRIPTWGLDRRPKPALGLAGRAYNPICDWGLCYVHQPDVRPVGYIDT